MKQVLWVDDLRIPQHYLAFIPVKGPYEVTWVKDCSAFVEAIKSKQFDHVCFDHDLLPEHYEVKDWDEYYRNSMMLETGLDCLKILLEYCKEKELPLPNLSIHTGNLIGRNMMQKLISDYGHDWTKVPVF